MVTINIVDRVHFHGDRVVVHGDRTGTTDDGYVMEHGVRSIVFNGHVSRRAFTDNWVHPNGSRFQADGSDVFNLNTGETKVERLRVRCIKP